MRRRSLLLPLLSLLISTQLSRAADPATPAPRAADLYFMAGQSNMQGSGTVADLPEPDRQPIPNASFWNGTTFEPLTPGRTRSPGTTQFGPEISFASTITAASTNRDVLIVKFALSGQPLHAGWDGTTWLDLPPVQSAAQMVSYEQGIFSESKARGGRESGFATDKQHRNREKDPFPLPPQSG